MKAFSEQLFKGSHVFVAGGSSGINLRIAQRYAEAGAKVSILSRDPTKIDAAVASIVDAGDPDRITAFSTPWGLSARNASAAFWKGTISQ